MENRATESVRGDGGNRLMVFVVLLQGADKRVMDRAEKNRDLDADA